MTEPVTIIGANTVINGNLEGDEDLTIEGRVEGTITLSRTLTIEANGVVHANINVRNAVISGVLVGNVEAQDSVHITEEGRVMGDIAAPRVILVDGSSFRGSIDMGDFDVDRGDLPHSSAGSSASAARPATSYPEYEEEEKRPAERTPTRVRTTPAARPERKPSTPARHSRPEPAKPKPKPKSKPAPAKKAKKKAPAPKVRAVGKTKATRKKR